MRFFPSNPETTNKKTSRNSQTFGTGFRIDSKEGVRVILSVVFLGNVILLTLPQPVLAVLPPDLIVSAGAQVIGVFSIVAAILVSVSVSVAAAGLLWYRWFCRWSVVIAFGILALALVLSNGFLFYLLHTNPAPEPQNAPVAESPEGEECDTCQFYGDSITLFVPDHTNPTVIELDMNRRQEPNQSYSHYYFLNGIHLENVFDLYTQFDAPKRIPLPQEFVTQIERVEPEDASVRAVYNGTIETDAGQRITFTTSQLQADFVTRNTPEYTQLQSPVMAQLTIDGEKSDAYALVENLHSIDFNKKIFFPEYDSIEAKTHQFILWDEEGSFYMIDDSKVQSVTSSYPSHSWLLFKDARTGQSKKGFETTVTESDESQWKITVPDFSQGIIEVHLVKTYQYKENGRTRHIVSGVVTDERGQRQISGILKIVQ